LNDEEARKAGTILLGADYQPVSDERIEIIRKNILVEWIKLSPTSSLVNQKIKDARIRTLTVFFGTSFAPPKDGCPRFWPI